MVVVVIVVGVVSFGVSNIWVNSCGIFWFYEGVFDLGFISNVEVIKIKFLRMSKYVLILLDIVVVWEV